MKKTTYLAALVLTKLGFSQTTCFTSSNVASFTYSGHTYHIVKELKSWANAATCAVSSGGYLVEITSAAEQSAVASALSTSGISSSYHAVNDGGGTSYIWIGASDITSEGAWIWDGDNNGVGTNFWSGQGQAGTGTGSVIASAYNNWGQTNGSGSNNEPDDFNGQDAAAIALTGWPAGGSSYGSLYQWNDINATNTLYYIIEYNTLFTDINEQQRTNNTIHNYPNPVSNQLFIEGDYASVSLKNIEGKNMNVTVYKSKGTTTIDVNYLANGVYFLVCTDMQNKQTTKKIIVNNDSVQK